MSWLDIPLRWVKRAGDGYSCENLFAGRIKVGSYYKACYGDPGDRHFSIHLPGIKKEFCNWKENNNTEKGKKRAEDLVTSWFYDAERTPKEAK